MFELLPFLYSYLVDLFASWMIVLAIFFLSLYMWCVKSFYLRMLNGYRYWNQPNDVALLLFFDHLIGRCDVNSDFRSVVYEHLNNYRKWNSLIII